jgi:hypothetical protein
VKRFGGERVARRQPRNRLLHRSRVVGYGANGGRECRSALSSSVRRRAGQPAR